MKKIVAAGILALAIIVGALLVYLSVTLKPEKYRPLIERTLSEKVGRSVSLGKVDFSLLGGLAFEVADLKIAGDRIHPEEPPLEFSSGKLKMRIIPLILGDLRIKEVVVDSPRLFLRKYRDGHLSIDDVLDKLVGSREKAAVKEEREDEALDLEIETVSVKQGSYTFVAELSGERVEQVTISPVNLKISNIGFDRKVRTSFSVTLQKPLAGAIDLSGFCMVTSSARGAGDVSFDLSGNILDLPATIGGGVVLAGEIPEFEGVLTSEKLEIEKLSAIYTGITGKELPLRSRGKGRVILAAAGTPDDFGFEGEMDLTEAILFYRDTFEKYADSELNLLFQGRYLDDHVIISNAEFRLPQIISSINGWYSPKSGRYEFKSGFTIDKLESVSQFFKDLSQLNLSGGVTTSVSVRGGGKERDAVSARADLKSVNFELPGEGLNVRSLAGHLEIDRESFSLNPLSGLLNGQRVSLTGKLSVRNGPRGSFTARANFLDIDSILEARAKGEKKKEKEKKEGAGERKTFTDMAKKADVAAKVSVDTLKYKGAHLNNVSGTLRLHNGEVTWEGIEVGIFDGKAKTEGSYSLFSKDRAFAMRFSSDKVSVFDFFKSVTSFGGFMDGVANVKLSLKGQGSSVADIRRTLSGNGEIRIQSGKIEGVDLLSDIGSAAGIGGLVEQHTGKAEHKRTVTVFDDVHAPFEIEAGEAVVRNFQFTTDNFNLKGEARLTADNRFVFSGDALIPREIVGDLRGIGKYAADDRGNLVLPLRIVGPINGLRVILSPERLLERKGKDLFEKERKKIEEKLLDAIKEKKLF